MLLAQLLDVLEQLHGVLDCEAALIVDNLGPLRVNTPQHFHAINENL